MPSVFLCHNHADKSVARRLGNWLREAGAEVWIDEAEIKVGESLLDRISTAIRDTDYVLALLSSNSVNSPWVKKELSLAMTKEVDGKKRTVLPIKLDDCQVPFSLSDKLYANLADKSTFHVEFEKAATSLDVSLRGTSVERVYVAKDWRTVLMVRTFAHRPEWRHPPYDIAATRRPLCRIVSVFGDRMHPVPANEKDQCVKDTVRLCLDIRPDVLGLGGMGSTAKLIETEVRKSSAEITISFWGRDVHIDAAAFLQRLGVPPPY